MALVTLPISWALRSFSLTGVERYVFYLALLYGSLAVLRTVTKGTARLVRWNRNFSEADFGLIVILNLVGLPLEAESMSTLLMYADFLQQALTQIFLVGPAEETFKLTLINISMRWTNLEWLSVITAVTVWTLLHQVLAYHDVACLIRTFVVGGGPLPAQSCVSTGS